VEAVGLPATATREFTWVGVNQVAVNRYVEAAITHGLLPDLFPPREVRTVEREVRLGVSRLDLRVNGNTYVEVKMPVANIQLDIPADIPRRELKLTTVDRMLRQVSDIEGALRAGDRAILLVAFCYDNPGFRIPESDGTPRTRFVGILGDAAKHGLKRWQVNFRVREDHVAVAGHWEIPV
jgi:sugar fermentation stimulation protein A